MNNNTIYKSATARDEIVMLYDEILKQWPVPNVHIDVSTRYGNTFVIASGEQGAPPLVLLHGSGSNSASWLGDIVEFSKHFRVYTVDMPGEPGKSALQRFSAAGPAFQEWLDDVLDGLKLDKVILGGISLGGWATVKYAVYRPDRIEKAVLIVPAGIHPMRFSFVVSMMALSFFGDWGRKCIKQMILKGADLTEEAEQFMVLTGSYFNYRPEPPVFGDDELRRLTMPVLFLAGEKDRMLNTKKAVARLRKLLPDLTVKIYQEDGHVTINKAAEVVSLLLSK